MSVHEAAHLVCGLKLHMVCDMGIHIQREAGTVVSQHTGHRFYVSTGLQSQGRERMPQVMEPYVRQSRFLQNSFHGEVGAVRCDRFFRSDGIPEDPLAV